MEGKPVCFRISHYRVYEETTNELVEDKIFFFFKIENPTGKLVPNNEGKFEWVKEKDIDAYIQKPFESKEGIEKVLKKVKETDSPLEFSEFVHVTKEF